MPKGATVVCRNSATTLASEVREYRLAIAEEAIKNYDLDGFDWDFCRFPRFFKKGTARDNAHLMTDLMRSIRSVLDAHPKNLAAR